MRKKGGRGGKRESTDEAIKNVAQVCAGGEIGKGGGGKESKKMTAQKANL